ncbi:MAG: hypothetical protein OXI90_15450 [Gammaproteobacteria bacterium]|nr:hypothetical protein [Gammaproteobacteria bacterium]
MKYRYYVQTETHPNVMGALADDHKDVTSVRELVLMTNDGATVGRFHNYVAWWREERGRR